MKQISLPSRYSETTVGIVRALSRLGLVYAEMYLMRRGSELSPNRTEDWRDGLGYFLDRAFEHLGTSADYSVLARLAIKSALPREIAWTDEAQVRDAAKSLWRKFCEIGGFDARTGKGTTPNLNPLRPSASDTRKNVIEVCASLREHGGNIYNMALAELRAARVSEAFDRLKDIRGAGPKVIPLFLRDVAIENEVILPRESVCDLHLQPVDRWVKRIAELLDRSDNRSPARVCLDLANAAETSPLLLNAGAWYFGSQIAHGSYRLREALTDLSSFQAMVVSHANDMRVEGQILKSVVDADFRSRFLEDLQKVWRESDLSEDAAMELARSELADYRAGR